MLPFSLRSSLMRVGTGDSWPIFLENARSLLVADDVFEGVNDVDEDEEPEAETLGNEKKKVPKDYLLLIDTVITPFYNGIREISEVWSPGSTAVGGAPRVAKGKAVAVPLQSLKDQQTALAHACMTAGLTPG
jgi:hypothetical protein